MDFVGTGNGAYADQHQAQVLPSQNLIPQNALRFCSGDNTGFVTVTHTGLQYNGTSQLTVNYHDSLGNLLYAFTKGNPRHIKPPAPSKALLSWSTVENKPEATVGVNKSLQSAPLPQSRAALLSPRIRAVGWVLSTPSRARHSSAFFCA